MKRALLIILSVLIADQVLKFWVKTTFALGDSIPLFGEGLGWGRLQFVENKGMAFGLEFGGEAGKVALTLFRMLAVVGIGWLLKRAVAHKQGAWMTTSLALVFAGALGNIIDSAFYGVLFSASSPHGVAEFLPPEGGYAPLLHGAVVDMFYFPVWRGYFPTWIPIWGGQDFEFFRPVFNIADAAITIGIVLLLLVQQRDRGVRKIEDTVPADHGNGASTGTTVTSTGAQEA